MRGIISRNHNNVVTIARRKHEKSHYQHQILLFDNQLQGVEIGFKKGVKRARKDFEIPSEDFLLLNARVDIEDLKVYYNKYVEEDEDNYVDIEKDFSQMIVKLVGGDNPKVLIGHSSSGNYNSMLKIIKTYRFNYHRGPDASNQLVANTDITFSSYPGSIASTDDFYLANGKHSRIIVAGVKMKYEQRMQVHGIDLDGAIFMSARVMAANRLAHNGKSWAKLMAIDPDFGAKQWLVIDEKRLKYLKINGSNLADGEEMTAVTSSSTLNDGLLIENNEIPVDNLIMFDKDKIVSNRNIVWLVDNTWKRLHGEDVTAKLKSDQVWMNGKRNF
jgi:hypothetical protein